MKTPFPEVLDSTTMAAFKSCPRKAQLESFQHWKLKDQSVHLHAGAAYASGIEAARRAFYIDKIDVDTAVAIGVGKLLESYGDTFIVPEGSAKSADRMAGALEFYFHAYPMETDRAVPMTLPDGSRGIEFNFLEPLDILHPVTGNPLLYSGRMDMMCDFDGMKLGEDDKTTSQLGASWPQQWHLRSQFTGYVWGAQRAGIKLDGFLVRGVSILKTKYDTMEAITYRPQWMIDRWYEQLLRDIKRMIQSWESGYFDFNLDHACAEYGGCPFRSVCQMRDPTAILNQQFERRRWDPVMRTETKLEEEVTE